MRLIDADKLLNKIDAYMCGSQDVMFVKELIKQLPTAFDVDKVVEQLEGLVEDREEDIINDEYTYGECSAYESAIRVVKAGGIDE
jgi:hypothetical protein